MSVLRDVASDRPVKIAAAIAAPIATTAAPALTTETTSARVHPFLADSDCATGFGSITALVVGSLFGLRFTLAGGASAR